MAVARLASTITYVPYESAYGDGVRGHAAACAGLHPGPAADRVPPSRSLADIIEAVAADQLTDSAEVSVMSVGR